MEEKSSIPCGIIKDILPLYVDELTSEESNEMIKQHLDGCEQCNQVYKNMTKEIHNEEKVTVEDKVEFDYLKKLSTSEKKKYMIAGGILLAIIILAVIKFCVIGYKTDAYEIAYVQEDGDTVRFGGNIYSNGVESVKNFKINDDGKVEIIVVRKFLFAHKEISFNYYIPKNEIGDKSLDISGTIVKNDGTIICKLANNLYTNKNPYIGDMSANGRIASALDLQNNLGNFTNELQTSKEPYAWNMIFSDSVTNSATFEEKAKNYACVLIAMIDNLGEVTFKYTVELESGPVQRELTVTKADCSKLVGDDIKSFSKSDEKVQELLEILGFEELQ